MLAAAKTPVSVTVQRKDYQPPAFLVDRVELEFDLGEQHSTVQNKMWVQRNPQSAEKNKSLFLLGSEIKLEQIKLNGGIVDKHQFSVDQNGLNIVDVPDEFELEITTILYPQNNTTLMGLYKSSGNFCTQCEAQGFRKITYYPDRPDVLSIYTVKIIAEKSSYPILLCNGNRVETGDLDEGRHFAKWHDPFPKPSYLFALVAGDLAMIAGSFTTGSGRQIALEIYSEAHNIDQCDYALESLQKSMRWDEEVYGLEYDLDIYMVVAVDDFNMGAMENKGLNIFNTKYVLADKETATDADFFGVESVIAHEYFHNWSGNRVTCRDWFQLSLKEGFTVYRDQEFSADMHSRGVKRIEDVNVLRTYQFREDSGTMAHPVRPESYQEINNFYTLTVYNKGAEVVRMIAEIVGKQGFRKGSDLYFSRHDGQAVTIEDFVMAMENANDVDLEQFRRWYAQAGTPSIQVVESYDELNAKYSIQLKQSCPPTPGQKDKLPFHIPVRMGLLNPAGDAIELISSSDGVQTDKDNHEAVLNLKAENQEFVFQQVTEKPVCSFLRGFSAPVNVKFNQSDAQIVFLMANDSDPFNKWDAAQTLMCNELLRLIEQFRQEKVLVLKPELINVVGAILAGKITDKALTSLVLTPPGEIYLSSMLKTIDPTAIHQVRQFMVKTLALSHKDAWLNLYNGLNNSDDYSVDQEQVGRRNLAQLCLDYLISIDDEFGWALAKQQYYDANNMTQRLGAFKSLLHSSSPDRQVLIDDFYDKFNDHALAMDKWLMVQAVVPGPDTLNNVKALEKRSVFDRKNPNKLRSLVGAFVSQNPVCFHARDGSGYAYLTDWLLELDPVNPQVAARLAGSFNSWRSYNLERQELMKSSLERILATKGLSNDVNEIVSKALEIQDS